MSGVKSITINWRTVRNALRFWYRHTPTVNADSVCETWINQIRKLKAERDSYKKSLLHLQQHIEELHYRSKQSAQRKESQKTCA